MMEEYGSSGYRPRGRALAVPRGPTVELKEVEVDYARVCVFNPSIGLLHAKFDVG